MQQKYGETTAALAEFGANLRLVDIPGDVVKLAKQCILDQLGVQMRLSNITTVRRVADYVEAIGSKGPCTVVGRRFKCAPEQAALANGVAGHGFELDDYHLPSFNHPGTVAVPAALAIGEFTRASGKQIVEAIAAGYEVMGRIGRGVQPSHLYDRGFHPQSTVGTFGAAVVAGRLLGLSNTEMANALGLAVCHAGGTVEYSQSGGETQRFHAGLAAAGGVRSALLAKAGLEGPRMPIEGRFGFCRSYSDVFDLNVMTAELGSTWITRFTCFKSRPYHGMVHAAVDVAVEAAGGRRFTPDEVESVTIAASNHAARFLGVMGVEIGSTVEAQFSLHMPVAHALLDGGTFEKMLEFDAADERIRTLARKVTVAFDEECEKEYRNDSLRGAKFLNKVTIKLKDGTSLYAQNYARGTPENPMSDGEITDKFYRLASNSLAPARVTSLVKTIDRFEELKDLRQVTDLMLTN